MIAGPYNNMRRELQAWQSASYWLSMSAPQHCFRCVKASLQQISLCHMKYHFKSMQCLHILPGVFGAGDVWRGCTAAKVSVS